MQQRSPRPVTTFCEVHKKLMYFVRADAKRHIRELHSSTMREFRCSVNTDCWHVGHLPSRVTQGDETARDIYGGWCETHHMDVILTLGKAKAECGRLGDHQLLRCDDKRGWHVEPKSSRS